MPDPLQQSIISEIKAKVRQAQYNALKVVNKELIGLYWEIGRRIAEQQSESWGKGLVPLLSKELRNEFPGIGGFSTSNLWAMTQFYNAYKQDENLQPLVGEISWTKHIVILNKCKETLQRQFYIQATRKYGWTKNVLIHQIENKTYEKYLLNQTNFDQTLPSDLRQQAYLAIKDEYTFAFLELSDKHSEKELEAALVKKVQDFLLEMGNQFTFIGNQFRLEIAQKEYFIDLLLYHRILQCLVAVELKVGEFQPEYKGKMEFYLNALNDTVKLPHENDAIGIIICKEKNRTIVEYSLKNSKMPIGVATYTTKASLPKEYKSLLPAEEEIIKRINASFQQKSRKSD